MSGLSRVFRCPVRCLPGKPSPPILRGLARYEKFQVVQRGIEPAPPGLKGFALTAKPRRPRSLHKILFNSDDVT
eukprot:scaffold26420_cov16-Prasinocladus_malaysianus.AAC.1